MGKFLDILLKKYKEESNELPTYDGGGLLEDLPIIDYPSLISPETSSNVVDRLDLMMAGLEHDLNEDQGTRYVGGVDPINDDAYPQFFTGYTTYFSGATGVYLPGYSSEKEEKKKVTFLNKKK